MKYRILTLIGLLALSAGSILQAQDYDDIYYDGAKSTASKKAKPAKTVVVYGDVPDTYKVAAQSNYRVERDVDEYNRRGAYDPEYALDLNGDTIYGDTIYEEAFANTHLIERFYNPDVVILSSDDDLIELYYDESPTVNLIVGSDWGYDNYMGWGLSYYPWYSWRSYYPWYAGWYDPWYSPRFYGLYYPHFWGWSYTGWYYTRYHHSWWWGGCHPHGWDNWAWHGNTGHSYPSRPHVSGGTRPSIGHRAGLATNRNGRPRVDATSSNRNGMSPRTSSSGNRPSIGGSSGGRGGYATNRGGGNMGTRSNSGVTTRGSGYSGGSSRGSGSYSGGSRSSGGSTRSSGSYSGGSRSSGSYGGGSYSGGSSRGGSSGGGGGSHGGSSGGGGHRR